MRNITNGQWTNKELMEVHETLRRIARSVEDEKVAVKIRDVAALLIVEELDGPQTEGKSH